MGPWVGSEAQNVSADICAARLGYHTAAAACHPPHPLIHIETWEYCTDTHTHSLSLTPTVFFLRFVSTFLVHSFQFYRAIFAHKQTHTCAHTHTHSHTHTHTLHGMSLNTHSCSFTPSISLSFFPSSSTHSHCASVSSISAVQSSKYSTALSLCLFYPTHCLKMSFPNLFFSFFFIFIFH